MIVFIFSMNEYICIEQVCITINIALFYFIHHYI